LIAIQQQGHASVSVVAENVKDGQIEIRLSDHLTLVLEMSGGPDLEAAPLDSGWTTQGWTVRRLSSPERNPSVNGKPDNSGFRVILELDPQRPGELPVTLPPLRYHERDQAWQTINWQPIPVRVVTAVLQPSLDELRDVAPPEDVPSDNKSGNLFSWLALGTALLIALPAVYWLMRRLRPAPASIPPDQWALRELDRIDVPALLQSGQEDRLGTLISDILRHYLDLRFHLGASTRTTAEFLATQSSDSPLSINHQRIVCELLDHCDLYKFAKRPLSLVEGQGLLDQARWLIEQTSQTPLKPTL
jgi:hypothetical protein